MVFACSEGASSFQKTLRVILQSALPSSSLNSVMRSVGPTSVRVRDIRFKMSMQPITNHRNQKCCTANGALTAVTGQNTRLLLLAHCHGTCSPPTPPCGLLRKKRYYTGTGSSSFYTGFKMHVSVRRSAWKTIFFHDTHSMFVHYRGTG